MKREFYFQDDRSNKFWSIEISGNTLIIENGRVGTKRRRTEKVYSSKDEASKEFKKAIRSKEKKGYLEGSLGDIPEYRPPDWSKMKMDEKIFWRIISLLDWKKIGDDDQVLKPALNALKKMEVAAILQFEEILSEKLYLLDTEEIARRINGDIEDFLSPDMFLYQRCVPVVNGQAIYESILHGRETIPADLDFEPILYLSKTAYEEKTGEDFEHVTRLSYETYSNTSGWSQEA